QAKAMDPTLLALMLDVSPHNRASRASLLGTSAGTRRAWERARAGGLRAETVLAKTKDPWLLSARRRFVPSALAGGAPSGNEVLHKNNWWFEQHLQSPTLFTTEEHMDLVSFLWLDMPDDVRIKQLRTIVRILANGAQLNRRVLPNFDERMRRLLKEESVGVVSLAIQLCAARAFPNAPEHILECLESTASRSLAIDAAIGMHHLRAQLKPTERARLYTFYEESSEWTGGGSFRPTLTSLLEALVASTPDQELLQLAAEGQLGATALATALAGRPALSADLAPALRAVWEAWGADDALEPAAQLSLRRGLLRAMRGGGAALAPMAPWLRTLHEEQKNLAGEVLLLLADLKEPADFALMAQGLSSGRFEVREACARYLLPRAERPTDPALVWKSLAKARSLGARTGVRLARVVARWLEVPDPVTDPERWPDELLRLERAHAECYPAWTVPVPGPQDGATWSHEQLLGFLERTIERPASPARGAQVFGELGCDACHVLGGRGGGGGGWGPSLDGVTRRLATPALLKAILEPSAEVADRYASSRLTLADGTLHEGRVAREDASLVELWLPAGTRLRLNRREVLSIEPSQVSPMPTGLLASATLEQLRDLFAYMAADGAVTPGDAAGAAWIDLLSDQNRANWGGTLAGWRLLGKVLEGTAEDLPFSTYMVYQQPFADFEVEFDVFAQDANSGLQYRSLVDPNKPDLVGYQADIGKAWWGSLFATDGRGAIAQPERILLKDGVYWKGWNHYHLRIQGDRHIIELNGNPMVDARDDVFTEGLFALQLHQKMKMQVWFTNLRVRPL
ncbi:MAG: putative heme-binding domain-containing protein, partial [Planctomycetota bacterium]